MLVTEKQKNVKNMYGDIERGNDVLENYFLGRLVDGVLNNKHTNTYTSDGWCFVDDFLVERIAKIVKATGAKIVLSSTWRKGWVSNQYLGDNDISFNELKDKFAEFGMYFMDKTPDLQSSPKTYVPRGKEIAAWLEKHKNYNIEAFVVIDDFNDMEELDQNYIVETKSYKGITEEDVQKAIEILNK